MGAAVEGMDSLCAVDTPLNISSKSKKRRKSKENRDTKDNWCQEQEVGG